MTTRGLLALALALGLAPAAQAVTCETRTPAAIALAAAGAQKCQDTIAREGAKFIAKHQKLLSKCKQKEAAGSCVGTAIDFATSELQSKAMAKIEKACADDAVQAGLSSSYGDESDEQIIGSCMLSQHYVTSELVSAVAHGAMTEPWDATGKERAGCVKALSTASVKFVSKALKNAINCLKAQGKAGTPGDLAPVCLGAFDGLGVRIAPTDAKTAAKQAKLQQKTEELILKKCGAAETAGHLASLFACPGAQSVADLQQCIVCSGWKGTFDAVEQQFSERGAWVPHTNTPGELQVAVGTGTAAAAANAGKKLLISPGTYTEEVTIHQGADDLELVGCGAPANRPRVVKPSPEVSGRGIQAANVDGLLFQSLDFFDQLHDHIRVTAAEGVTFRDITGDGNDNTAYAVFPILSNDVLVELCKVKGQDDAPIYVGQSSGIVVRYNDVREGVAGIEIENCGNAQVYGNYGTNNTAGLLVFKDGNLPIQLSECHDVHHNLFEDNNRTNIGTGAVGDVPEGTGILVISSDSSTYSYNLSRGNNSAGFVLTDQLTAGFNLSAPGDPRTIDDNWVYHNVMSGNGLSPDPIRWPLPIGYDLAFLALDPGGSSGHCELANVFTTQLGFGAFASMTPPNNNLGTCVLPAPVLPSCPAPSIVN